MPSEVQGNFGPILSQSPIMKEVIKTVGRVAASDVNILLTGESGTGKNLLARAIHNASKRRGHAYVPVNCIAIPDTLIESELFGHEKGAYTDAHASKRGSFESANGGTLFLDEIGDMTGSAQGKILQAIEEKHFKRLGSEKSVKSDVRIISATNKNLTQRIHEGNFREDLYYRLREVSIHLPPLRERREDLPLLIHHFVECYAQMYHKPNLRISNTAVCYLAEHSWPGNFRELKNIIKSAVILCPKDMIWLEHFPFEIKLKTEEQKVSEKDLSIDTILKRHIEAVLKRNDWNKKASASDLGISRPRLDRYIKSFELIKGQG